MTFAAAIADIALEISAALGGPFHSSRIITPGVPVRDAGGSITTPAAPTLRTCYAQIDSATEQMRGESGFVEQDRRMLVLTDTITGAITTDMQAEVLAGPYTGSIWTIQSVGRDPTACYHELRIRPQ